MNIKSDLTVNQIKYSIIFTDKYTASCGVQLVFSEMLSRVDLEMRWFLVLVPRFIWQVCGAVGSGKGCHD